MKNILKKLKRHKSPVKTVVWGVRVPEKVKNRWLMLAGIMRIPVNRLVAYSLEDWAKKNIDILTDNEARNRLADKITKAYLENKPN